MPFSQFGDVSLFYTDEGAGPSVLFVHGFGCDSHDWNWQLPAFARNYRCIAVDLRGHGRSSAPAGGYHPQELAADLHRLVTQLECGPVAAIGHSLGGLIAAAFAVDYPGDVAALVAVDPAYHLPPGNAAALAPLVEADDPDVTLSMSQALLQSLTGPATPAWALTWYLRRAAGTAPHALRAAIQPLYDPRPLALAPHSAAYLQGRACPVLALFRDHDCAAAEAAILRDSRSAVIKLEDVSHWYHQEQADEFNALVLEWLASL